MATTPNLAMSYIASGQAQKEATHNDALNDLDFLVQPSVLDHTLSIPPASPSTGDCYIIGASPTGAWAGSANAIAGYYSGWRIKMPEVGWVAFSRSASRWLYYTGSGWSLLTTPLADATTVWNPGAITTGSGLTSAAITLTGAALGDFAQVAALYDLQGIAATAYVSAANTVRIRLNNMTGGTVTLASGTWRVRLMKA